MISEDEYQIQSQNMWDKRFSSSGYVFGTEPNKWLAEHYAEISELSNARGLAVADGEGRNGVWLSTLGLKVDAFDISPVAIAKAKVLATEHGVNVNFWERSQSNFQWPEAHYDVVVAIFVQYATPVMRDELFERMRYSLKTGGKVFLLGYTPRQLNFPTGGPRDIDHLYTREMLEKAFEEMDILELEEFDDILREGPGHSGPSALIGLVAQKKHLVTGY